MEDELEFSYRSGTSCSSVTCTANNLSEKLSSESQIKSLDSSRGIPKDPHTLSEDQDLNAALACEECQRSSEPLCHIRLESVNKLKESTKQLLCLLEEIQSKTRRKNKIIDWSPKFNNYIKSLKQAEDENTKENIITNTKNEIINTRALRKLEASAKYLDSIYVEDEHDNCSIYRRLTRMCYCLNHPDYNDFVIHFNEDCKYTTSNLGEIIKNMRILRKFLYMGGSYTKNALMFLNEGMIESPHSERVEMTQACVNADICNIFDDHSIVIVCISWPCKNKSYGDYVTQALAAGFLYKLAQLEDGRRYLNYSSKINNDIKKVLRKKSASIEVDTIESLNATLNLLNPFARHVGVNYFKQSIYEGVGKRTLCDLVQHRKYMTYDEVLTHLEMLDNYSQYDNGKKELTLHLPLILTLFKNLLMEYNNSEINVSLITILNSIISHSIDKQKENKKTKSTTKAITETSTQAINSMKTEACQFPPKKIKTKKHDKSKIALGDAPNKFRQASKKLISEWEPSNLRMQSRYFKKSSKMTAKKSIILVSVESKEK